MHACVSEVSQSISCVCNACMHVCMHVCMYARVHVCMHARLTGPSAHACVSPMQASPTVSTLIMCTYACMHACMRVHVTDVGIADGINLDHVPDGREHALVKVTDEPVDHVGKLFGRVLLRQDREVAQVQLQHHRPPQ